MISDRKELVMWIARRLLQRGIDVETVVGIALDLYDELRGAAPTQPVEATTAQAAAQTATTAAQAATVQQSVTEEEWTERLGLVEKGICPRCGREFRNLHLRGDGQVYAYHDYRKRCYLGRIKNFREAGIDVLAIVERIRESQLMVERLMNGFCPRCGERAAKFSLWARRGRRRELYAIHTEKRKTCYVGKIDHIVELVTRCGRTIEELERALGFTIPARERPGANPGISAGATLREQPPQPGPWSEWREMLERGICPKCGEEIRFIRISRGREVYARHSGGRSCYLATVGRLESAGIDIEAVRSAIAARRRERLSGWVEKLRQGVCPRCGEKIQSIMILRPTGRIYAWHDDRSCYLTSVRVLEKAGMDIEALLNAGGLRVSWGELREWFERLRQGVCPRCGREVHSLNTWQGVVSAIHELENGRRKGCFIATLEELVAAGVGLMDVIWLKLTLRGLRKARAVGQSLQPSPPSA